MVPCPHWRQFLQRRLPNNSQTAFLVGMAASIGAGISTGFAEALSDDGVLSGRGRPWMRGGVCGIMTTLGGIGHTMPFLLPDFYLALWVAVAVVAIELGVIAWIRKRLDNWAKIRGKSQPTPSLVIAFRS